MRLLIVLLCFATSSLVFAQESRMKIPEVNPVVPPQLQFNLGLDARWEKGDSQELEQRNSPAFSFAYRTQILSALFEYSKFTVSSGNASLATDRTHEELIAWGRWHFLRYKIENFDASVYGGLGIGAYQEKVQISLMGSRNNDESGTKVMTGAAVGADASVYLNQDFGLIAALEGRGLMASDFDPNPTRGGVLRIGILLNLR